MTPEQTIYYGYSVSFLDVLQLMKLVGVGFVVQIVNIMNLFGLEKGCKNDQDKY